MERRGSNGVDLLTNLSTYLHNIHTRLPTYLTRGGDPVLIDLEVVVGGGNQEELLTALGEVDS